MKTYPFLAAFIILLGISACDEFSFSPIIPISTEVSEAYTFSGNGSFSVADTGKFFSAADEENVLGNIKDFRIDSVAFVLDSLDIPTTDSIPLLVSNVEIGVDSIKLVDNIAGTFQDLLRDSSMTLNFPDDQLVALSQLITIKANNKEEVKWYYRFFGTVNGAPFTVYFRVVFYGELETFPDKII